LKILGKRTAKAYAPASVANVAVGFDLFGFAVDIAGDTATVEVTDDGKISVGEVSGLMTSLPTDPLKNTATAGLVQLQRDLGLQTGFRVSLKKGIPLGSGLGGSAASSVAAIVAANSLLENPLKNHQLLKYALIGEFAASGSYHADNIAPSLYGGMTLAICKMAGTFPEVEVASLPVPENLWCVLFHPAVEIETRTARSILKKEVSLSTHVEQSAHLAAFMVGLYESNVSLLRQHTKDLIVEPQRKHLIPNFDKLQSTAFANGAICCTISGAGPTVFAWAQSELDAKKIESTFKQVSQNSRSWSLKIPCAGARVLE
jgi:homoserine kinase